MGFCYTAQRSIAAPPPTVWHVLTDRQVLVAGDFGITQLDGGLAPGERITLRSAIAPNQAFKLQVTTFKPNQCMVWTGGMPLGLFTGRRTFTLAPAGEETDFSVQEVFSGPLAGLIGRSMPDLQPSFEQFADALKQTAEERAKGDAQ